MVLQCGTDEAFYNFMIKAQSSSGPCLLALTFTGISVVIYFSLGESVRLQEVEVGRNSFPQVS